jgi:uncharacterized protein (TIGR03437 family)
VVTGTGATPTGTVTWSLGSTQLGQPVSLTTGSSTVTLSVPVTLLPVGQSSLSATYSGDAKFNPATGTLNVTLAKFAPGVTISTTANTLSQNGSVVLTATVTGAGSLTPTGTITWSQGTTALGVTNLSSAVGQATTTLTVNGSALSVGTVQIQAVYSGDASFTSGSATQSLTVTAGSIPAITSGQAIVSAASFQAGIAANSWIAITGTNLSAINDTWANAVLPNGQLPTVLDGVSVTVGGKPAYVSYVSPTQINVLAPNVAAGTVAITVTTPLGTSTPVNATATAMQPAFFQWGIYAVATRPDFSFAVKNGVLPGLSTVPAKPGDVLILWGTSFGPGNPVAPAGFVTPSDKRYNTANTVTVTLNGAPVNVLGAALTPETAGLYQVAIQLPTQLANGDYQVVATVGTAQSPSTTLLSVQN